MLPVLFDDEHYLVIDKPAGLAVESPTSRRTDDLVSMLPRLLAATGRDRPAADGTGWRAVERVDRFASGLVTFARSEEAAAALAERLSAPTARNRYLAVVRGRVKPRHLVEPPRAGKGQAAARPRPTKTGAAGVSLGLRVLRSKNNLSLVTFEAPTASEADLRRKLFMMGVPVLGDVRYSRRRDRRQSGRYFLHRAGFSVYHPFDRRMLVVDSPRPAAFDAVVLGQPVVGEHLRTALASRLPCLLDAGTDSYRLITGQYEGVPGLVAQRYGPVVLLEPQQGKFQGGADLLRHIGQWYARTLGVTSVYASDAPKDRSRQSGAKQSARLWQKPVIGAHGNEEYVIRENGLRFLVRPFEGFNVGLFLDQRENRRRVRELAANRQVLNLFAYTCGFSVAAAAGGATAVTSVDQQKSRLEQGKVNFGLNGLPLDGHWFICSEAFEYFTRARRQSKQFDLIILDPPTFARSKKPQRAFRVEADLRRLIEEALTVLTSRGLMLISTNSRRASKRWLSAQVAGAAGSRRFTTSELPLPVDFAVDRDHAKSLIVRFT
ncbi:MAG: class I SAM-dependent methyltransferase [Phycisphaerales bacterium]|nr:MAG: class I SAM-dependent methyltransferase [Phycisphaerales bacterium]